MGVYIKGMEMPTSCWECRFNASTIDHHEACLLTKKAYNWGLMKPPSDCPLVPVPPHGDLIDKDATMNEILEERGEDTACWFAGIVNDMPAIVPSDKAEDGET